MDEKLIEALQNCVPFAHWFEKMGCKPELSTLLSLVLIIALGYLLVVGVKKLRRRWIDSHAAKKLDPQFDFAAISKATRIYIPTQYQNASPARQDEPGFTHQYISRSQLIPFFIHNAFKEKSESERFYLILADSGMGKTTFMINLYLRYHSFFNFDRKYKMRLFRFSHSDTMDQVKQIKYEEAKDTILLLDALDEDPYIVSKNPNISDADAFRKRVDFIINATRNFAEVVMTCRTQYFPGQENDPYELQLKRPDEKGFYTLNKLYVSPFTDAEVKKYLRKRYGYLPFINREKKKRAAKVVGQSRHLVMRPMMLSYIDLLVEDKYTFTTEYSIYEALIQQWLKREADKRKYKETDRKEFINNLEKVSEQTAVAIWRNWQKEQRMYLSKAEAVGIAAQNNLPLKAEEVTGQSLLTCDGLGNWKFAHKSIWEFFLAKEVLYNPAFSKEFYFTGMDVAKRFFGEKLPGGFIYVEGGLFERGSAREDTLHKVKVNGFWILKYPVTQAKYMEITGKPNPSHFKNKDHNPVENVSWLEAAEYCNALNRKFGFGKTYNTEGNMLDQEGKPTSDLGEVRGFRLPTEAEWEFAARGGNLSKGYEYSGSNNLKEVGWFMENAGNKTHPVGGLKPNELGLYDMSGNVWEWCHDWFGRNYYNEGKHKGIVENPPGPDKGESRVLRGGSWTGVAPFCRSAYRRSNPPALRYSFIGFRPVFVL